ncbi:MAG: trigger factor [Bacteroidales bacterium]|nr:trigger factor [Bacteroidales bacterium]
MNIKRENTDELNAVLTVTIEPADYEERVDNVLKDYRKKARLDGFRPGNVPIGLIRKMYRKPVLIEEVNKILGESVAKYFTEEKLYIIGEPLPHEDDAGEFNWESDREFTFSFDIGLAPETDIAVTEKDKIPYYTIKVNDEVRNKHIDQIRSRFGSFEKADVISDNEMIKADIVEVSDEGKPVDGGIRVEEGSFSLEYIQEKKIRDQFSGCNTGDQVVVNLLKAFPNETDLAALLKIDKGKLPEVKNNFRVTIKEISRFKKAVINQDLFDALYGKEQVASEDEFKKRIDEELKSSFERESEYQFRIDSRDYYLKKFKQNIPDGFYKRWLLYVNEEKLSEEQLEKDYEQYAQDLKWQLIKSRVIRDHELKASEEELLQHVAGLYRAQFMQYYGMSDIPAETLEKYAREALSKEDERRKFAEMVLENKVFELIRNTVKHDRKEVTLDKFNKMREK